MDRITAHLKAIEKRLDGLSEKELSKVSLDMAGVQGRIIKRIGRLKSKNTNVISVNFRKRENTKRKSASTPKRGRKSP